MFSISSPPNLPVVTPSPITLPNQWRIYGMVQCKTAEIYKYLVMQIVSNQQLYLLLDDLMTLSCERCKDEVFKYLSCDYCSRKICNNCIKSSARASKISRLVICKDCWGDLKKRERYKNKLTLPLKKAVATANR